MSRRNHRNLLLALLVHRSRWLVISDSIFSGVAALFAATCLALCILWSSIGSPVHRYRACTAFQINLSYKVPLRIDRCSKNQSWPLPQTSYDVAHHKPEIRLSSKWSTLHYPGMTFPSRLAGWHYVPLANVSSGTFLRRCKTMRPTFLGYTFRPNSALHFL